MLGPYIHDVDPILADVGGVHLWWYGLSYALGFAEILYFLLRHRRSLRIGQSDAYALALCVSAGVLLGGRAVLLVTPAEPGSPAPWQVVERRALRAY